MASSIYPPSRLCQCGCGKELPTPTRPNRVSNYLRGHNNRGRNDTPDSVKFHRHYVRGNAEDCWEWTGSKVNKGYGKYNASKDKSGKRRQMNAHRMAYMLANDITELPKHIFVLHKCDNPPCVNPNHLFPGTNRENVRDMWAKGRGYSYFREQAQRTSTE